MNWLNRAELRFSFLGIPGLPRIIVALNALVFVLYKLDPGYLSWLVLDPDLIRQGQVWRVVTFLFVPSWGGLLPDWLGVVLYLLYINFIGLAVERALGSFRLTLYYVLGMIGQVIAGFFFGGFFGNGLLNLSLLFAFVRFYPDAVFLIMFILPVRAVWLAWISAAGLVIQFVTQGLEFRLALLAGFLNYLLFFGVDIFQSAVQRQQVASRRQRFDREMRDATLEHLHECAVCHRNESTPDLDFRVARDGQEYCLEHLPRPAASQG